MSKRDRSKGGSRRNPNEGTAARTRPLSFEEIMYRRKKKQNLDINENDSNMKEPFGNANGAWGNTIPENSRISQKSSKSTVKESYKKEQATSKSDGDLEERKVAGINYLEVGTKSKSIHSKSSRDKMIKDDKHDYHKSRTSYVSVPKSHRLSGRKQNNDSENGKYDDHYKLLKRDGKRKGDTYNDGKSISEYDSFKSKKHDSFKEWHTKNVGRDDHKKYHLESVRGDPRLKRRRSRSLEHDQERGRSASSMSPSHARAYHGQEYGESYKEKSKKKHSDNDTYRSSGNARHSSGHHRKRGSGLGGYSPRKRKTEAAIKTPSPTVRSPEKKGATWDQPPPGTSKTTTGSIVPDFTLPADKIVEVTSATPTLATMKVQPATAIDPAFVFINASVESVQLTQATRPLRRLYIENLPQSASEKSLMDCLNDFLFSCGAYHIQGSKPCISCIINKDKLQALVEFLTPEDATAALSFDGHSFSGSILKVRRPKDFFDTAIGVPEKSGDTTRAVSDVVINSPYKIFVGGISEMLSSKMLMDIATAFGIVRAFHFDFSEELNGPCAFLEYEDHSITSKACAGLNGLKLGGCILTAAIAFPDAKGNVEDYISTPSYSVPPHAKPLLEESTKVLKLQNVFDQDLSVSENDLEETLEDIRIECARFGTVKSLNFVRHSIKANEPIPEAFEGKHPVDFILLSSADDSGGNPEKGEMHLVDIKEDSAPNDVEEPNYVREEVQNEGDETKKGTEQPKQLLDIDEAPNVQTDEDHQKDANPILPAATALDNASSSEGITVDKKEDKGNDDEVIVDKTNTTILGGEKTLDLLDIFEPGCVLVEFQRKEAACLAAHCLHGRSYGERVVAVDYIRHDLYLKRFPK
ncbi:Splicing factor U2af large subunit B [Apostasia shenzhenica]|uniref:Splicing factor U2af large subunit B n=1 Tax=Apostasia shenzhenica TaxID=1088818 RepID=A0A2I0AF28_9ASPA|nr:Splicing factor U2af large subunit B [Apostasia shenzhenica]